MCQTTALLLTEQASFLATCLNLDAVSDAVVWVCIYSETVLSFFSVLNLLKIYFLTFEIPERCSAKFWGGGGEGFGWLCYCTLDLEVFSVVSGKFLKHQQH